MTRNTRTTLLFASALLMIFAAFLNATDLLPDLRGDLIEIGVRKSVLGPVLSSLYFGAMAMGAFALLVTIAAVRSMRGAAIDRLSLAIVAAIYGAIGISRYTQVHSPHHLGTALMGALLAVAVAMPVDGSASARDR